MKRLVIALAAAALLLPGKASAQELTFKPYGFVRNYVIVDSRATKSLSEDLYFFLPLEENLVNGTDVNKVSSFNFQAITTRLGVDFSGYKIGGTEIKGKIEADFYCMNSGGNVGTFRMRQAYVDLVWKYADLKIGQGWHPMAADMAHGINLETAAPFSPFNRSAQAMLNVRLFKPVTFTFGFLQQLQYRSNGPAGSTNKYQRHAMPEVYAGLSFSQGNFLGRVGMDILSLRPHYGYDSNGKKYDEWFSTVNPFVYLQYTYKDFQVKAKSTYAQAAEYMQMNSGYAVCGTKTDGISNEYTPLRSSASFVSFQYGKKFQVLGMFGYFKALGTTKDITGAIYFSGNGFKHINQIVRVTPTLAYNLGKLQFAMEYDMTNVEYGDADNLTERGLTVLTDRYWVQNHRLILMAKFTF